MLNTKEKINTNIFVGQGATYSIGGDSYPYTVIEYKNDIVTLQSDKSVATKNSDYFNNQIYITAPDSNGTKRSFKQYNYYGQKRWFEVLVFLVLAFSGYSVGWAGHYGSQLVYIEGVGPQGKYLGNESEEGHDSHSH